MLNCIIGNKETSFSFDFLFPFNFVKKILTSYLTWFLFLIDNDGYSNWGRGGGRGRGWGYRGKFAFLPNMQPNNLPFS